MIQSYLTVKKKFDSNNKKHRLEFINLYMDKNCSMNIVAIFTS